MRRRRRWIHFFAHCVLLIIATLVTGIGARIVPYRSSLQLVKLAQSAMRGNLFAESVPASSKRKEESSPAGRALVSQLRDFATSLFPGDGRGPQTVDSNQHAGAAGTAAPAKWTDRKRSISYKMSDDDDGRKFIEAVSEKENLDIAALIESQEKPLGGCSVFANDCRSCSRNPRCRFCALKFEESENMVLDSGVYRDQANQFVGRCVDVLDPHWNDPITVGYRSETDSRRFPFLSDDHNVPVTARCHLIVPDPSSGTNCVDLEWLFEFPAYHDLIETLRQKVFDDVHHRQPYHTGLISEDGSESENGVLEPSTGLYSVGPSDSLNPSSFPHHSTVTGTQALLSDLLNLEEQFDGNSFTDSKKLLLIYGTYGGMAIFGVSLISVFVIKFCGLTKIFCCPCLTFGLLANQVHKLQQRRFEQAELRVRSKKQRRFGDATPTSNMCQTSGSSVLTFRDTADSVDHSLFKEKQSLSPHSSYNDQRLGSTAASMMSTRETVLRSSVTPTSGYTSVLARNSSPPAVVNRSQAEFLKLPINSHTTATSLAMPTSAELQQSRGSTPTYNQLKRESEHMHASRNVVERFVASPSTPSVNDSPGDLPPLPPQRRRRLSRLPSLILGTKCNSLYSTSSFTSAEAVGDGLVARNIKGKRARREQSDSQPVAKESLEELRFKSSPSNANKRYPLSAIGPFPGRVSCSQPVQTFDPREVAAVTWPAHVVTARCTQEQKTECRLAEMQRQIEALSRLVEEAVRAPALSQTSGARFDSCSNPKTALRIEAGSRYRGLGTQSAGINTQQRRLCRRRPNPPHPLRLLRTRTGASTLLVHEAVGPSRGSSSARSTTPRQLRSIQRERKSMRGDSCNDYSNSNSSSSGSSFSDETSSWSSGDMTDRSEDRKNFPIRRNGSLSDVDCKSSRRLPETTPCQRLWWLSRGETVQQ